MADVNVNLSFTADTSKAQQSIKSLQASLTQLTASGSKGVMSKEMEQASVAAKELSYHLNQAFNAKTGNFDLSRLDKSLKASGQNIDDLSSKLLGAGQQGQQAFIQLAQTIAQADRPMITLSNRLTGLFTTLKNTAKWQISSSILHGFMGAVQSAYGYAQDLNESLNNIRIVTGYGVDKMAQFAAEANNAAKALSTTTTAYTDASLIYYQQGLGDQEVKERTDVTVKMANVARESAQTVSDQMTAIWNNFDDGSHSLEYYADVMTKLGAATAASTSEIAEGLEKFAAVSDTVGLSYEYATAALATVVDKTRQSADTVGTAFKTLFARIEGLSLGETLEDGTDLNKYSEALLKVGINIKDTNGELKDMDIILDELGSKWKDLSRDEQVALAQTVAGVRQYNQMLALMNNYDAFKENVGLAENSSGTLQQQADIYAESWEAAQKRVKASAESLYTDLIDDSFFIKLNNGLSGLLDSIDAFIDGMGGIGPVIAGLGSMLLGIFANKVPDAVNNLKASLNILFKGANTSAQEFSNKMLNTISNFKNDPSNMLSQQSKAELENAENTIRVKSELSKVSGTLSEKEAQEAQIMVSLIEAQQKELVQLSEIADKKRAALEQTQIEAEEQKISTASYEKEIELLEQRRQAYEQAEQAYLNLQNSQNRKNRDQALDEYLGAETAVDNYAMKLENLKNTLIQGASASLEEAAASRQVGQSFNEAAGSAVNISSNFDDMRNHLMGVLEGLKDLDSGGNGVFKETKEEIGEVAREFEILSGGTLPEVTAAFRNVAGTENLQGLKGLKENIQKVIDSLGNAQIPAEKLRSTFEKFGLGKYFDKLVSGFKGVAEAQDQVVKKQGLLNSLVDKFHPTHVVSGIEAVTKAASGLGSTVMTINSIKSAISALNNEDLSIGEKITTVFMSISMGVGSALSALKSFSGVAQYFNGLIESMNNMAVAQKILNDTTLAGEALEKARISLDSESISISQIKTLNYIKEGMAERGLTESIAAGILVRKYGMTQDQASIIVKKLKAGASFQEALAEAGLNAEISGGIVIRAAATAATWLHKFAQDALNRSLSEGMALMIVFVAALVALAAIIAGVVVAVKAMSNAYNADAIAAEKAHEKANELSDAYDKCKQHYEDMINTMSEYKEARKSLEELTKGTEEYSEALRDANRAASELIQNNPDLFGKGDYHIDEKTGELIITESAVERAKKAMAQKEAAAYSAAQVANAEASLADAKSNQTDLIRDIGDSSILGTSTSSETIYRPLVEALQQGLMSGKFQFTNQKDMDEYLKQSGFTITERSSNDLYENRDAIIENTEALRQAGMQYETATTTAAQALINSNERLAKSPYGSDVSKLISGLYGDAQKQEEARMKGEGWGTEGIWKGSGANEAARKVFEEYIKANPAMQGAILTDTTGSDDNRRFVYKDKDGQEGSISLDAMKSFVASVNANQTVNQTSEKLIGTLANLDGQIEKLEGKENKTETEKSELAATKAMASLLSKGDLSGLNSEDITRVAASSAQLQQTWETLSKSFSEKELQLLGLDKDFGSILKEAQDKINEAWSQISKKGKEVFADMPVELAQQLDKTGLDPSVIKKFYEGLSDEEKTIFAKIDFDTYKTQESWKRQMEILQSEENIIDIELKISNIDEIQQAVADGDYSAVLDAVGPTDFERFMGMTSEEQTSYLNNVQGQNYFNLYNEASTMRDSAQAERDLAYEDYRAASQYSTTSGDYFNDPDVRSGEAATASLEAQNEASVRFKESTDQLNESIIKQEQALDGLAKAYDLDKELIRDVADGFKEMYKDMNLNDGKATELAAKFLRLQDAVLDLNENSEDYIDLLNQMKGDAKAVDRAITQNAASYKKLKTTMADLIGVSEDMIDRDFLGQLDPKELQKAANGDEKAIERIQDAFASIHTDTPIEEINALKKAIADYNDGEIIDKQILIDNAPALMKFVETQIAASTTEAELRQRLQGLPIDFDVVGMYDTLAEAQAAADESGGFIADALSLEPEMTPGEDVETDIHQNVNFRETYFEGQTQNTAQEVMEDGETKPTTVFTSYTPVHKTVQFTPTEETSQKSTNTTAVNYKTGTGKQSNTGKHVVLAPKKSFKGASSVAAPTQNTINNNNSKGGCFIAGTLISLRNEFKPIEDIRVGDIVLSYNEKTKKNEYSEVLETMIHVVHDPIYDLYIKDEVLHATGIHRFLIERNNKQDWIAAQYLQVGDKVLFADGTLHEILDIQSSVKLITVYNFEVSNNHNYYVGHNQILAHNKKGGGSCFEAGTLVMTDKGFEVIENIKKGDIVLSYNEEKQRNEYSEVLQTMIHIVDEPIYKLYAEDDVLNVTGNHKFLIKRNDYFKWLEAESLIIGDQVFLSNGKASIIIDIHVQNKFTTVYNFEVSGNHNYYVGKAQILAHNKGKEAQPAEKKDYTKKSDIVERYKRIDDKLKALNKNQEKYNTLTDHAYGASKIKKMDQVINNMEREVKLQKELVAEATRYAAIDRKDLASVASQMGVSTPQFDTDGYVSNVESIKEQMYNKWHAMEVHYNTAFSTKEQQEEYEKNTMEPFKKLMDQWEDVYGQYYEALDRIVEAQQRQLELQFDILAKKLERATAKLSFRVEFRFDEIEQFSKAIERLDRVTYSTAARFAYWNAQLRANRDAVKASTQELNRTVSASVYHTYTDKNGNEVMESYDDFLNRTADNKGLKGKGKTQWINERRDSLADRIIKNGGVEETLGSGWDITAEGMEQVGQIKDDLETELDLLYQIEDQVNEEIPRAFEKWQEQVDRHNDSMNRILNKYQIWMDIIDTLGENRIFGKDAAAEMAQMDQANVDLAMSNLQISKDNYDTARAMAKSGKAALEDSIKTIEETAKKADDSYNAQIKSTKGAISEMQKKTGFKTSADMKATLEKQGKDPTKNANYIKFRDAEHNLNELTVAAEAARLQVSANVDKLTQEIADLEAAAADAEIDVLEKFQAVVEAIQQKAVRAMEQSRKDLEASLAGPYKTIDAMQQDFDWNKKRSEQFLADYERVYQLTKLNRDLEKRMDESSNVKAKQKLAEYQERILLYAKEGVKMSQYDLEYMQKQYDLEVAKIALEEAQNAKSQVRLTRDAEGNYSYTYTADENKTAEAEQTYEDKLNEILHLSNDYQEQMLANYIAAEKTFMDALAELDSQLMEQHTITQEEYNEQYAILTARFAEEQMYYQNERAKAARNNLEIWALEYDVYYSTTEKKIRVDQVFSEQQRKNIKDTQNFYITETIKRDTQFAAIAEKMATANGKQAQQYLEQLEKLNTNYNNKLTEANASMVDVLTNNVTITKGQADQIQSNIMGIVLCAEQQFLPKFNTAWLNPDSGAVGVLNNFKGKMDTHKKNVKDILGQMNTDLKAAMDAAGIKVKNGQSPWTALKKHIKTETSNMKTSAEGLVKTVNTENTKAKTAFNNTANIVKNFYNKTWKPYWLDIQQRVIDTISKINELTGALNKLSTTKVPNLKNLGNTPSKSTNTPSKDTSGNSGSGSGSGNSGGASKNGRLEVGDVVTLKSGREYYYTSGGVTPKGSVGSGVQNSAMIDSKSDASKVAGGTNTAYGGFYVHIKGAGAYSRYTDLGWVRPEDIEGYDTGGYTGEWGSDGRWALLHQKEMVLNKKDTENLLTAVKTVRDLAAMVDLQAQNARLSSQYNLALGQLAAIKPNQKVEQDVHISAEFPNVQDHSEIELALTSLVNRASQYAWKN